MPPSIRDGQKGHFLLGEDMAVTQLQGMPSLPRTNRLPSVSIPPQWQNTGAHWLTRRKSWIQEFHPWFLVLFGTHSSTSHGGGRELIILGQPGSKEKDEGMEAAFKDTPQGPNFLPPGASTKCSTSFLRVLQEGDQAVNTVAFASYSHSKQ